MPRGLDCEEDTIRLALYSKNIKNNFFFVAYN
jgi:hypothetical protein